MPNGGTPRIGILGLATSGYADLVREAGGRPVKRELLGTSPKGGVALRREWVADQAEVLCSVARLDALLVGPCRTEDLAGLIITALRLNLPTVVVSDNTKLFDVVPYALGLTPLTSDTVEIVVELASTDGPRSRDLVNNFSLANALRAGLVVGAGPELLVHLAAIAREAGVIGFPQMIRVLAPESPEVAGSSWLEAHGAVGLFAHLGDALHDTRTVTGQLKENLPPAPPVVESGGARLVFIRGRASGTEIVCRVNEGAAEISGDCRFYSSEEAAVRAVEEGTVGTSDLLVVIGCGPRGGPGLLRLDRLGVALREANLNIPVLTDGLLPENAAGSWASLATPEAAAGGVIGRLRDGDFLRLDLVEGLIRTGVKADEIRCREPFLNPTSSDFGYVARYARTALPPLEGAGFG